MPDETPTAAASSMNDMWLLKTAIQYREESLQFHRKQLKQLRELLRDSIKLFKTAERRAMRQLRRHPLLDRNTGEESMHSLTDSELDLYTGKPVISNIPVQPEIDPALIEELKGRVQQLETELNQVQGVLNIIHDYEQHNEPGLLLEEAKRQLQEQLSRNQRQLNRIEERHRVYIEYTRNQQQAIVGAYGLDAHQNAMNKLTEGDMLVVIENRKLKHVLDQYQKDKKTLQEHVKQLTENISRLQQEKKIILWNQFDR